ncbi:glycolate oxidase subunit GlcE [Tepidamorphus sp. 3E244]|uniref:glycolate oxidase subunit GlcE n=1 Tax=Tepidamorphus sp. 3E244 TaxID=3385498 RepID=UPI0038FCB7E6
MTAATVTGEGLLAPETEDEVVAAVQAARRKSEPLEILGGGTKRSVGRPMQTAASLTTRNLTGVTLYEPSELVIRAGAGTPLAEIEATLAENRQRLAFEPPDWRVLLKSDGTPTIGALAAANLSGPRRIFAGSARDALIGVRMVTGRGEAIKSGGRVMKNVTGYDLVKFSTGSWGTLGVLTEVTFKVLPQPETETTLAFEGLDAHAAVTCMSAALGSPFEVSGAAHLPASSGSPARTLLRIEGFGEQMTYRFGQLKLLLAAHGTPDRLDATASTAAWQAVRDVELFAGEETALWRVSVAPSRGPDIVDAAEGAGGRAMLDWGGGLVWAAMPSDGDAGASALRGALAGSGHATLIRAPETVRAAIDVFQPQPAPVAALSEAMRHAFDPDRILNPGRMYAGAAEHA